MSVYPVTPGLGERMPDNCAVCFSGYRPEKFPFPLNEDCAEYVRLRQKIRSTVLEAVDDGYTTFLCGMAMGFDLLCTQELLVVQAENADRTEISLVAVLPFAGHGFSGAWQAIHQAAVEQASEVVTLAPAYQPGIYFQRNRYMVNRANRLICYFDGQPGGTAHTVSYARKKGLEIINVAGQE